MACSDAAAGWDCGSIDCGSIVAVVAEVASAETATGGAVICECFRITLLHDASNRDTAGTFSPCMVLCLLITRSQAGQSIWTAAVSVSFVMRVGGNLVFAGKLGAGA